MILRHEIIKCEEKLNELKNALSERQEPISAEEIRDLFDELDLANRNLSSRLIALETFAYNTWPEDAKRAGVSFPGDQIPY